MDIGQNIKTHREAMGLSRKELASLLGVNISTISRYETDVREPSFETLLKIANAINTPIENLLGSNTINTENGQKVKKVIDNSVDNVNNLDKKNTKSIHTPYGYVDIDNDINIKSAFESLVTLVSYIKQDDILENMDDKTFRNLFTKVCDSLEFEAFKIKNNK